MATVNGTAGNDFIHVTGDGHAAPGGYTDNPGATEGNDLINPNSGADTVFAGGGNDTIAFDTDFNSSDSVDGGAGTDTLTANSIAGTVSNLTSVEQIDLGAGQAYSFGIADSAVAARAVLIG